jgi:tripartite-type tricarboxylate transporter receptor subunit TctC
MNNKFRASAAVQALRAISCGMIAAQALCSSQAFAQNYPAKPIRLIVGFPPGGSVDVIARLISPRLSESLGQQVIVDNRSGASGNIAAEFVMNSPPDGYVLMSVTVPYVVNPYLFARVPYDARTDFVPVSLLSSSASLLVVHPSVPARSVRELLALAKSRPGALNYSAAGAGTNPHIAGELFNLLGKVDIVAVQFKGGGPADLAVIAGEVGISFPNISQAIGYVASGRLRALGVTSAQRAAVLPDLPTVAESGIPGYEFTTWHGILAPKGTPRPIVVRLNEQIKKVLTTPEQTKLFADRGLNVIASTPEEFGAHIDSELRKWSSVVKERGLKVD